MRLGGCVERDDKIEIRGTSCMLNVHKPRDTSPRDDECRRAQYDEQGVHRENDTKVSTDV